MPGGFYGSRVIAGDRLDSAAGAAKTTTRTSSPFEIDNTAPRVTVTRDGESIRVDARDNAALRAAYVSVDSAPWFPINPEDGMADADHETFTVDLREHLQGDAAIVLVKVFDRAGNVGAGGVRID